MKQLIRFYIFREECFQAHVKFEKLYQSSHCSGNQKLAPRSREFDKRQKKCYDVSFKSREPIELEKQALNNNLSSDNEVDDRVDESSHDSVDDDDSHTNAEESKITSQNVLLENKNDSSNFSCSECSKVFRSKYGLNAHIKIHLDLKNAKCEICGKQFTR